MGISTPDVTPVPDEPITVRSHDVVELFESLVLNDVVTSDKSVRIRCGDFSKFNLYLDIESTSTPTTVQFQVRFHDPNSGKAHIHKQGLFASLFYEDTDVASGVQECFRGDVAGREFSLRVVGAGTDSSKKFTVSASVEFYN